MQYMNDRVYQSNNNTERDKELEKRGNMWESLTNVKCFTARLPVGMSPHMLSQGNIIITTYLTYCTRRNKKYFVS